MSVIGNSSGDAYREGLSWLEIVEGMAARADIADENLFTAWSSISVLTLLEDPEIATRVKRACGYLEIVAERRGEQL